MMPRERVDMSEEDLLLYRADPDFARELGIVWPHCGYCGQSLMVVLDPAWEGKGYVEHTHKGACVLWIRVSS